VVPYYNKPMQEGLYRTSARSPRPVDIPMLLYNVPSRTVADLANDTIVRLAEVPEHRRHQGSHRRTPTRVTELIARKPASFVVLSGDDSTALPYMMLGAKGRDLGHRQHRPARRCTSCAPRR
jgi:4-hydroxy-tetrahydrodipicolinate synthase